MQQSPSLLLHYPSIYSSQYFNSLSIFPINSNWTEAFLYLFDCELFSISNVILTFGLKRLQKCCCKLKLCKVSVVLSYYKQCFVATALFGLKNNKEQKMGNFFEIWTNLIYFDFMLLSILTVYNKLDCFLNENFCIIWYQLRRVVVVTCIIFVLPPFWLFPWSFCTTQKVLFISKY